MLARRSAAEVRAADQDLRLVGARLVEYEARIGSPCAEQAVGEPCPPHQLEPGGRDDLVGVDVAAVESDRTARYLLNACHHRSPGALKCPATAVAAATAGDTRCVRPPGPCLPSKFLLLVEAERSPGARMSPFIPRHMEHPAERHSNPASRKYLSRPSASAAALTLADPGRTRARTPACRLHRLAHDLSGFAQVLDPAVRARADEDG